nr:ribonuclease H-like domain-containing protein [Tanacetum cinerariifolium]
MPKLAPLSPILVFMDEYNAFVKNSTWVLVSKPPNVNVVQSKRLFGHEYHADGLSSRYEAPLVANGRSQQFATFPRRFICISHRYLRMLDFPIIFVGYRGDLNYFLRISVRCDFTCMFLSQNKYLLELLDKAPMATCNSTRTLVDTESKLGSDGDPVSDPTISKSSLMVLQAATYIVQNSRSSVEAEYRGVANVVAKTAWLHNLFRELHKPLLFVTLVYCNNVNAIYLTVNPVQHQQTKHIEIDMHFVHDIVARGQ